MLEPSERRELVAKAKKLAEADFEVNGAHINAPYAIVYKGIRYKGRIKATRVVNFDQGEKIEKVIHTVYVEQPVLFIGQE